MRKAKRLLSTLFLVTVSHSAPAARPAPEVCEDLEIDEQRVVDIAWNKSRSKVEQLFTIKRSARNRYDLYVKLDFRMSDEYRLEHQAFLEAGASDNRILRTLRDEIHACFDQLGYKLRDRLGRRLRLYLYEDARYVRTLAPPAVKVDLRKATFRSHSRAYAFGENCSVYIHEALHLAGLVDEYHEEDRFPYRAHTDDVSVMAAPSSLYVDRNKWVLKVAHLDTILYPNCQAKNARYYTCAGSAYRRWGWGFKLPTECLDPDWVD
jgi:hypothetical protein